ncbi:MAG: DUF2723 domain-containing protein [Saprospiraceae bacterium]|nr:DUF2723 domain-containing protein [Saprospiraceae bacterium]
MRFRSLHTLSGWIVFAITFVVYCFSVEWTGSLWDCGEFVSGAYKLQVVHPPGAPLFLLVGRMFVLVAQAVSDNPADIAYAVNILSAMCSAFAAMFVCWTAGIFGKLALVGRDEEPSSADNIALMFTSIIAGLATAFSTSIWFSAVEGEVYAMSTMFTTLTVWSMAKWYELPDDPQNDRWMIFAVYAAALSIGVHLLSLLTFPALALLYYFKKYKTHNLKGAAIAFAMGVLFIALIQIFIIVGIPKLWATMELLMVNTFGLPIHSGIVPTLIIVFGALYFGLSYTRSKNNNALHSIMMGAALSVIGFSILGIVMIRANANTPINMNNPNDPIRLLPYLNREQYGERPLLRGPHFDAKPIDTKTEDRYGRVGDHYEVVDKKVDYVFDPSDMMLLPRIGHYEAGRPQLHRMWMGLSPESTQPPTQADNMSFLFRYQLGWMYWRYFMWNFAGRQNGEQGYYPWDPKSGHWYTGIKPYDEARLYKEDAMPDYMKDTQSRNKYYLLPLFFGVFGILYHFNKRPKDFAALLALFIMTGIAIIFYSNQPPNEPRERDYVLVGSFFTFCIWIGMGVLAIYDTLIQKAKMKGLIPAVIAGVVVLSAPILMGTQNYDDMSRRKHTAARDYAKDFLESCAPNALIFTYGDNDTYPLWYAQEVENIRTDVRVVNLSLIAVDWYIEQLRRKVNKSDAIKMTIPIEAYRGFKRNQVPIYSPSGQMQPMAAIDAIKFAGEDHPLSAGSGHELESYLPSSQLYINVDPAKVRANHTVGEQDTVIQRIDFNLGDRQYLIKDDLAVLDIIASNAFDRPIYFAVTCRPDKLMGLDDYFQLEGLAIRLVPVKSQSDPVYGMVGKGRVNKDAVYDNIMHKFAWGNFDKERLYVSESYMPSVQSIRAVMIRTARAFLAVGDKQKAIDIADKYFQAFPDMNFPYEARTFPMMVVYFEAGAYEKSKPQLKILVKNLYQFTKFCYSIDRDDLEAGFKDDLELTNITVQNIINAVEKQGDKAYADELRKMFEPYSPKQGLDNQQQMLK